MENPKEESELAADDINCNRTTKGKDVSSRNSYDCFAALLGDPNKRLIDQSLEANIDRAIAQLKLLSAS